MEKAKLLEIYLAKKEKDINKVKLENVVHIVRYTCPSSGHIYHIKVVLPKHIISLYLALKFVFAEPMLSGRRFSAAVNKLNNEIDES